MHRHIALMSLLLLAFPAAGQLIPAPRSPRPVEDASIVIDDRGSSLEIYQDRRARPVADKVGKTSRRAVFKTTASAPINASQLGVVFNHAMQCEGYITGEIAFKLKPGRVLGAQFAPAEYPGLKVLISPDLLLVVARTPAEFALITQKLRTHRDVEWVEPLVMY